MSSDSEDLEKALIQGDSWLLKYGVVSSVTHNNIVLNLRVQFPAIKNLEYYLDTEHRKIDLIVYLGFWRLLGMTLFGRRNAFMDSIIELLQDYLYDYNIKVKVRRYKR